MTDETKQLFDAPWIRCRIEIEGKMQPCVSARTNHTVAISFDEKDANRLARLPELYDALMEAAKSYCQAADFDCPKKYCAWASSRKCKALKWLDLMKKVRDGE